MQITKQELREFKAFSARYKAYDVQEALQVIERKLDECRFPNMAYLCSVLVILIDRDMQSSTLLEWYDICDYLYGLMNRETVRYRSYDSDDIFSNTIHILSSKREYFKAETFENMTFCTIAEPLFNRLKNKNIYLELLENLVEIEDKSCAYYTLKHIMNARQFYIDERAYLASAREIIDMVKFERNLIDVQNILAKKLEEEKKNVGIYDVSREEIGKMEEEFKALKAELEAERDELAVLKKKTTEYERKLQEEYEQTIKRTQDLLHRSVDVIGEEKQKAMLQLEEENKRYKKRMSHMQKEFESKVRNITVPVGGEVIGREVTDSIEIHITGGEPLDLEHPEVPILDSSAPLIQKAQLIQGKMKKNEIYHDKILTIGKLLLTGSNPYLVGPSGSGKSHCVKQIAEIMGLRYYSVGYINEEYKLTGFKDANSNFDPTPFYNAYRYGGICFFDELDNSHPGAILLMNEFLGTKKGASFRFPDGVEVAMHPYFRIIAAGNTWGEGADRTYNTRAKLDGAFMNRFNPVEFDYDPQLEMRLTSDPKLLQFLRAFRYGIRKNGLSQPVTYRDIEDMDMFISQGLFSVEEAIKMRLIKGNKLITMQKIVESMKEYKDYKMVNNRYYHSLCKLCKVDIQGQGA